MDLQLLINAFLLIAAIIGFCFFFSSAYGAYRAKSNKRYFSCFMYLLQMVLSGFIAVTFFKFLLAA